MAAKKFLSVNSDIWAFSQGVSVICFPLTLWVIHTSLFLCMYCNFLLKKKKRERELFRYCNNSGSWVFTSPLQSQAYWCLHICLLAWLYDFSEVYFSHSAKLLMCAALGMCTVILDDSGFSLTVSFLDLSVKLSASPLLESQPVLSLYWLAVDCFIVFNSTLLKKLIAPLSDQIKSRPHLCLHNSGNPPGFTSVPYSAPQSGNCLRATRCGSRKAHSLICFSSQRGITVLCCLNLVS